MAHSPAATTSPSCPMPTPPKTCPPTARRSPTRSSPTRTCTGSSRMPRAGPRQCSRPRSCRSAESPDELVQAGDPPYADVGVLTGSRQQDGTESGGQRAVDVVHQRITDHQCLVGLDAEQRERVLEGTWVGFAGGEVLGGDEAVD